jgi:hypothetical protein
VAAGPEAACAVIAADVAFDGEHDCPAARRSWPTARSSRLIRAVRQLAKRGVDIIQIMVSGGLMTVGHHIPSG